MYDVVSLAEALIDFSQCGFGPMGNPSFEMNPGGSGANVLIPNVKLGGKSGCLGMVGKDLFGDYILKFLKERGLDISSMKQTDRATTRLAFVSIDETGDRFFNFVKGSGMKHLLTDDDIDFSMIDNCQILTGECCNEMASQGAKTIEHMISYAVEHGKDFAFDFNYRPGSYRDEAATLAGMKHLLSYASYVKACEDEMAIITGLKPTQYEEGAKRILEMDERKKIVFITLGPDGAYYASRTECGYVPGFKVDVVDTTGCGDAFMGTVLHYLTHPEKGLSLNEIVIHANAMGALTATKRGGIDSVPSKEELFAFLKERGF